MKHSRWTIGNLELRFRDLLVLLTLAALLSSAVAFTGCSSQAPKSVSANPAESVADAKKDGGILSRILPGPVTISSGTTLSVRLLHSVSSRSSKPGDEFDAELTAPVTINGKTVFPKAARVRGRVVSAKESGRLKDPGYLKLTLWRHCRWRQGSSNRCWSRRWRRHSGSLCDRQEGRVLSC